MSIYDEALALHKKYQGKLETTSKVTIKDKQDLSRVYTPGVAEVSRHIHKDPQSSFELTMRGRTVAVVSDGSAVLGLGDIGAEAAMPVMEGKAVLFKQFAKVDAVPLCINLHTEQEIISFVKAIAPSFAGINLEDIKAPRCFEVEDALQDIGIPVFHDDQHGTAIVVRAAIMNASKLAGKKYEELTVVISGAGAAGTAIAQLLLGLDRKHGEFVKVSHIQSVKDVILTDSKGIISLNRNDLDGMKEKLVKVTNTQNLEGSLSEAMKHADVFVGVSKGGVVSKEMVSTMKEKPIIFAMANPDPEILPEDAYDGGAFIVGTGRSDFPNQINNVLAFPGFFKGLIDSRAKTISIDMKIAASNALATFITPTKEKILPSVFDQGLSQKIAESVKNTLEQKVAIA